MFQLQSTCLLMIILLIKSEGTDGLKILGIFPIPVKSHYTSGEIILKELVRRGHSVDVVTHFPQNEKIDNYNDISLAGSTLISTNNLTIAEATQYDAHGLDGFVKKYGRDVSDLQAHKNFEKLMNTPKGTYDVIIIELLFYPSYLAFGQKLGAPIVGFVACKLHDWLYDPFGNTFNPSYIPSVLSRLSQPMTFWERVENTLITHLVDYKMNKYFKYEIKQVEKYFNRTLSSLNELYDDVSLMLVNQHFSLNDITSVTPDIIDIGGLHVHHSDQKLTPDLQEWLDESTEGCVYFTFGSMINIESMPEQILRILYETFERISPVRVLLKIADANALPTGLPKNVRISSWLPQTAVLKHNNTKLFITHGGLLGTQEAITYKVPMIGLPVFGDQPNNIQNYVNRGIAIALSIDTLTADSLTNAINSVLTDLVYRKNVEKLSDLFMDRPMSPLATAVYWIEYTARHGKVLKSPATQLNWWQLNSLDVYGFIIMNFLVIIFMIRRLLTFLLKFRQNNSSQNILNAKKHK